MLQFIISGYVPGTNFRLGLMAYIIIGLIVIVLMYARNHISIETVNADHTNVSKVKPKKTTNKSASSQAKPKTKSKTVTSGTTSKKAKTTSSRTQAKKLKLTKKLEEVSI